MAMPDEKVDGPIADEQFSALLADLDEALAAGGFPEPDAATPANLVTPLRQARDCLLRLEQDRCRSQQSTATAVSGLPPALGRGAGPRQLGRFELRRQLGHGGFGIVFLAYDPLLRRKVALKVPRLETFLTPELRDRFLREGRAAAGLDHPNLVSVYDAGEVQGVCYIVSAYCPGPTLATWLKQQRGPIPPKLAARLVAGLADAVQYIHDRHIWHRDIKPGNILLEPVEGSAGRTGGLPFIPRLTDFGLAKVLEAEADLTRKGDRHGTPAYMAPEQGEGRLQDVGPASDVYALGVVLYEVLTGQPPFRGATDLDTLRQVLMEEPVRPSRLRADVRRDLDTICLKCLEKDPCRRYGSAGALAEDLGNYLAGRPIRARQAGWLDRGRKWARRRPAVALLLALSTAAVVCLLAGAAWYAVEVGRHNEELTAALDRARTQTEEAKLQRRLAENRARLNYRWRYDSDVRVASREWENKHGSSLVQLLNSLRPLPGQEDARGFEWYYLWRWYQANLCSFAAHRQVINCLALSPDGGLLASASDDLTVKLWDVRSAQQRASMGGFQSGVDALAFPPDGKTLIAADHAGIVQTWDIASGRARIDRLAVDGPLAAVALSPEGSLLAMARPPGSIDLWDVAGRKVYRRFRVPFVNIEGYHSPAKKRCITSMAFSPGGALLAVGCGDWTVKVMEVHTGKLRATLSDHRHEVCSVAFSPDGRAVASASLDRFVRLWAWPSGRMQKAWACEGDSLVRVAFAPNGRAVAAASGHHPSPVSKGIIRVWDVATGKPLVTLPDHAFEFNGLAFTPDGATLALGDNSGTVRLWHPFRRPEPGILGRHDGEAWAVTFTPDGKTLASGGDDHAVKLWDVAAAKERATLRGHTSLVTSLAVTADGRLLASGSFDRTITLWDLQSGQKRITLRGHTENVRCVAFAPDGRTLASGDDAFTVRLWDVTTGRLRHQLRRLGRQVRGLAFSPNGKLLASASSDRIVRLYDPATAREIRVMHDDAEVFCAAFAPDGKVLATGNWAGAIKLWDVADGQLLRVCKGHQAAVRSVAFSADGKTLASAGDDKRVKLWDPVTGQEFFTLRGHTKKVAGVAFAPNVSALASASEDTTVRLWRAAQHQEAEPATHR
jgi:WD40 repeat protein